MGGIVLRRDEHARGLPLERLAQQTRQRVRHGCVDFRERPEIRIGSSSAASRVGGGGV